MCLCVSLLLCYASTDTLRFVFLSCVNVFDMVKIVHLGLPLVDKSAPHWFSCHSGNDMKIVRSVKAGGM